jgi:tetratricopeptide (TPR) repeat protein
VNESPSSAEEAIELFLARRRRGEELDPVTFAAEFPELGPDLRSGLLALDALLVLERATAEPNLQGPAIPDHVGPYRVVRELGRGGMGVVVEAVEEPLGRRVALKLLPPELVPSVSARARFKREAELAARLDHSGIATIYGAGVAEQQPWIAMRYVEGETLARAITRSREGGASCVRLGPAATNGRAAATSVAACMAKVARALQAAHALGVVHRDIKPSNIIVMPDGAPVLLDFGLAIAEESEGRTLTRTGDMPGTPAYFAPEHVTGERVRHDAQSDVYALGVTLYECSTLRRPFEAPTTAALYRSIAAQDAPGVRSVNRDIPRDLAVIVATAMERDCSRRYRSAAALAEDLEAFVAGRPIAARPIAWHGRITRWVRREPRQAALLGSLVAAAIALSVFVGSWWTSRGKVLAADRAIEEAAYEASLQEGFGNLNPQWSERSAAAFRRALTIHPRRDEALAGLALAESYRSPEAALAVLDGAPQTTTFDALRAVARGESPVSEQRPDWFAHASAVEMFIDGMRLKRQLESVPYSAQPPLARLAESRFQEAIRRSPTARFMYHHELALAARLTRDEGLMRSAAAALLALWPEQERALYLAGSLLLELDPRAAVAILEKRVALFPEDADPYTTLASAYYGLCDYDASESAARKALERAPRDPWAYNLLHGALRGRNCPREARDALQKAVERSPNFFEAWANLGLLDAALKENDAARFALRCALNLDPGNTHLRLALVQLLEEDGYREEALREAETVLGLSPQDPQAWIWIAELQLLLGRHDLAFDAARAGLEIAPEEPDLVRQRDEALRVLNAGR